MMVKSIQGEVKVEVVQRELQDRDEAETIEESLGKSTRKDEDTSR